MKKSHPVFIILICIVLNVIISLTPGCGSTPVDTVGKVEGITVPSVNAAMSGWRDWVVAGHATQAQVDAVKKAYITYYNAQLVASNAVDSYFAAKALPDTNAMASAQALVLSSTANVGQSQTNLLNLITTLKK